MRTGAAISRPQRPSVLVPASASSISTRSHQRHSGANRWRHSQLATVASNSSTKAMLSPSSMRRPAIASTQPAPRCSSSRTASRRRHADRRVGEPPRAVVAQPLPVRDTEQHDGARARQPCPRQQVHRECVVFARSGEQLGMLGIRQPELGRIGQRVHDDRHELGAVVEVRGVVRDEARAVHDPVGSISGRANDRHSGAWAPDCAWHRRRSSARRVALRPPPDRRAVCRGRRRPR